MNREKGTAKRPSGQVLAVQSTVCGVILLIALLLRLAGGGWYSELKDAFRNAITDDFFSETVVGWLDSPSLSEADK